MHNYVAPEEIVGVSLSRFRRYLVASGWRRRQLKPGYSAEQAQADLFSRKEPNGVLLQLPLPLGTEASDYQARLRDALQTLVDAERRSLEEVTDSIQHVGFDILRSAIPTEYLTEDSVRLSSARAFTARMRELLASSATAETNRLPFFLRQRKESLSFADSCRFGHTYRGSFGFVLESPLPALTESLFKENPPVPFERRVVQRIARGIQRVQQAVEEDSTTPLTEGFRDGLNANGCEDLADLVTEVNPAGLLFTFQLSPEWVGDLDMDGSRFEVGPAQVDVCRTAAKELRRNETAVPARVAGLVVRLQNDTDPTDLDEKTGAHEVFLLWSSEDYGDIRVKLSLTPPEYLESVRAHAAGRPIYASGILTRIGRQWLLRTPRDFGVNEQRELAF